MDLKRMGRISGFVAAVAMLAMVLQGCGSDGDGGSGISQDMYDALQAELDAAEDAQMTAEATAAAAMEAQMTAEAARDAALEAQAMAMTEAADAMAAEAAAEMARQAAVTAQQIAAQAEMDARAAEMAAQTALEAAETMRDMYQQGQMDAEAERDMYMQAAMDAETAADDAEAAQMTADNARIAAETALAVAKQAEMDAVQARMEAVQARMEAETARDDYKAKLAKANEELEDLKMAMMEDDDEADMAAVAAQRARVDAVAIEGSASGSKLVPRTGKDLNRNGTIEDVEVPETARGEDFNGDGDTLDTFNELRFEYFKSEPLTEVNFQGSQPRPEGMKLTASHDGSMVTFTATKDEGEDGRDIETLIDLTVPAGSGDTAGSTIVEGLPGGHDKDITLMTDIMAPLLRGFGANLPPGLVNDADLTETGIQSVFHAPSQTYRYPVQARDAAGMLVTTADDATVPVLTGPTNTEAVPNVVPINLSLDSLIDITLGSFAPSASTPVHTVQSGGQLPGEYAGVAGMFRCGAVTAATAPNGCDISEVAGDLLLEDAWEFVPSAANVSIADSDFLVYGAWLKRPQSQVGVGYSAGISSTSMAYDNNATDAAGVANGIGIAGLIGKATYEGSAAGHFAERFIGTDEAKSGRFTAAAELTADFGVVDATATPAGTSTDMGFISGSITDFVRDDGVAANWVVDLMQVEFQDYETQPTDNDPAITNPGGFVAGRTGGHAAGADWSGNWGVELAGPGGNNEHPTGVVGTFGAEFGSPINLTDEPFVGQSFEELVADEGFVGVIGGFGARKVAE